MSVIGIVGARTAGRVLGTALAAGVVVLLAVALLGVGPAVGPAVAGDAVAQFGFGDAEPEGEPGETVTVEVRAESDGGYADEGIVSYGFVVAVPPDVGEPTAVEPGPWLAQGEGEVDQTVTDAGEGAVRIRHERVGAEDGVTGEDVAATVTIELHEDAPAADAVVVVADTTANLRGSDYRMQTFGDEATIVVAGGGEVLEPAYEPGDPGDDSVEVVTAEDANRSVDEEEASDESDGGTDGGSAPTPGFGIGAVVGSLAILLGVIGLTRWRRRHDG